MKPGMLHPDDQPLCGLGSDHSRRSGMKDTISHYVPPYSPLTSTEPQALSNNLTMPASSLMMAGVIFTETAEKAPRGPFFLGVTSASRR